MAAGLAHRLIMDPLTYPVAPRLSRPGQTVPEVLSSPQISLESLYDGNGVPYTELILRQTMKTTANFACWLGIAVIFVGLALIAAYAIILKVLFTSHTFQTSSQPQVSRSTPLSPSPTFATGQIRRGGRNEEDAASVPRANLLSTSGWRTVSASTYSVRIPPDFDAFINADLINLRRTASPEPTAPIWLDRVDEKHGWTKLGYPGGSRQEWYERYFKQVYDPRDGPVPKLTLTEKLFGSINGLEASLDEGRGTISILVTNGNNLYIFSADPQYLSVLETIVSTVIFPNQAPSPS